MGRRDLEWGEWGGYYNVHRWYEAGLGRYERPDPLRMVRAVDAYRYAGQRPIVLTDPNGLQATGTGTYAGGCCPSNETCCEQGRLLGYFDQAQAGGLGMCCSGRKVPCALSYPVSGPIQTAVASILMRCTILHEDSHLKDLPDCPQQCGVTASTFATRNDRAGSECKAANVEMACLVKGQAACGGNPDCLAAIQASMLDLTQRFKPSFGCIW